MPTISEIIVMAIAAVLTVLIVFLWVHNVPVHCSNCTQAMQGW